MNANKARKLRKLAGKVKSIKTGSKTPVWKRVYKNFKRLYKKGELSIN